MRSVGLLVLVTVAMSWGCGDDGAGGSAGGPDGGSAATGGSPADGGSGAIGGSPGEGGSGATGGGGAGGADVETRRVGAVVVQSLEFSVNGTSVAQSSATALFFNQEAPPCELLVLGDCALLEPCEAGEAPVWISAGAISISGGARDITLVPAPDDTYPTDSADEPLFAGGEPLTIELAGSAEVPAHTEQVTAPAAVEIASPTLATLSVIERSSDLVFTWSEGNPGDVLVRLVDFDSKAVLECTFPGEAGAGAIPSDVLQLLPPTTEGLVQVSSVDFEQATIGGYSVSFGALGSARDSSGALYQKNGLTLE